MAVHTSIEWANEFIKIPGNYSFLMTEAEARAAAEAYPEYRRLVRRDVVRTDWEEVS